MPPWPSRAEDVRRQVRPPIWVVLLQVKKNSQTSLADSPVPRANLSTRANASPAGRAAGLDRQLHRLEAGLGSCSGQGRDLVDGRYTIQSARKPTDAQLFEIRHLINEPPGWIAANLKGENYAGLRLADHAGCRALAVAQGGRRTEGGGPKSAGRRLDRSAAGADPAPIWPQARPGTPASAPPSER